MPTNGYAFKEIVAKWSEFTDEPCNVRLSLETNVLIHLERFSPFTQCGLFLLSTITFLLNFYINSGICLH
jgi:hypothetical protein